MGTRRNSRIAKNQSFFRGINDAAAAWPDRRDAPASKKIEVYCECADLRCYERVCLTVADYEAVRAEPARFVVLPGHVFSKAERVCEERDGYLVVEKNEDVRDIVEELDPRGVVTA